MAEKEYIERDIAIKELNDHLHRIIDDAPTSQGSKDIYEMEYRHVEDVLRNSVPSSDVRPVVTCERCVYHIDCGYHYCNKWCEICPDNADFFCAYGEEES